MRVLIIEDDGAKLQAVAQAVESADGIEVELETAHNASQAKRILSERKFDVVILDIALPVTAGQEASPLGGLDLMEEVTRRPRYQKPDIWIGLTAYDESYADALPRFSSELWSLIHFDPTSDAWAQQIVSRLKYMKLALESSDMAEHQCDLCVVTALADPELSALLKLDWNWSTLPPQNDGTTYYEGHFAGVNGRQRAIVAAAPQMGMTASAVLATKMILRFVPRYIAMCGIAAGIRGTCELGDIICPDPCWDWGSGKFALDKKGKSVFQPAPSQLRLDASLRGRLTTLSQDRAVWDQLRRDSPIPDPGNTVLSMRLGPFASGAAVLSDDETAQNIKQQHRQLVGIDMEAYAIFAAASESPMPQPKPFVLKSVVDFADSLKGDSHRTYAAYTSAQALRIFAERFI